MGTPNLERTIRRFPRSLERKVQYLSILRYKYPAPACEKSFSKSSNPADMVLEGLVNADKKQLKKMARKHSLESTGHSHKLIKRLYLHWRASKLGIGKLNIGYGPGYESTQTPTCACGFITRKWIREEEQKKIELRESQSNGKKKADKLWMEIWNTVTDEELRKTMFVKRFPRLLVSEDGNVRFPR